MNEPMHECLLDVRRRMREWPYARWTMWVVPTHGVELLDLVFDIKLAAAEVSTSEYLEGLTADEWERTLALAIEKSAEACEA